MNGPEHYLRAEELLAEFANADGTIAEPSAWHTMILNTAQVHATLALAAATAMGALTEAIPSSYQPDRWADVIGWTRHGLTPEEEASEQRAAAGAGEPHDPF